MLIKSVLSLCVVAISAASAYYCSGNLYGGRSIFHVWWYGWVTALSTGLGAFPMLFFPGDASEVWLGVSNAIAAGMMTSASLALIQEGMDLHVSDQSALTATQCVAAGGAIGVAFIAISQRVLAGTEDAKLAILEGVDARRALLIVLVMTLHSFSEGIGIGVSFGGQTAAHLGMLVTTTLAVHNVPEGFAVSSVLVSKGMSVWGASLWSIFTSLPQPVMAVAAFCFVDAFALILPLGLGFAAGAMLWVAWLELLVEACEQCGLITTAIVGVAAAGVMALTQAYLEGAA